MLKFYYFRTLNRYIMMYFLIIAAIFFSLLGLVGAVVPGIAGPPFSFLALLLLSFVDGVEYSTRFLVIMGILGAIVFALDYVVPVWGTKTFGGSKAGVRGSTIGMFAGLIITLFFPIGFIAILLGPFIGAYIGEKTVGTEDSKAWKSAFGSFVGFLFGTGIKIVYDGICVFYVVKDLIGLI